jgi:hypothetical protein
VRPDRPDRLRPDLEPLFRRHRHHRGLLVATLLALAKNSDSALLRKPAAGFIFLFRGSPLFIQFFFAYEAFVLLPRAGIELDLCSPPSPRRPAG